VSPDFAAVMCRAIPATPVLASAESSRCLPKKLMPSDWTFKGPRALRRLTRGRPRNPELLVMCDIPLDLERRFERRWAARFSGAPQGHHLERQQQRQQLAAPSESKRKTRRVESAGLQSAPSGMSTAQR
jgi:hypothetical protein